MTCIDDDIKVLKKYEPFGLVMYKMGDTIAIPSYIIETYYDLYKNLLDLFPEKILFNDTYYIKSMVLDI